MTMADRQLLIEAITREVIASLGAGTGTCVDCGSSCAAHSPDKVRDVVTNGASRITYQGRGGDVPQDLARYIDHTMLKPDATAA